MRGKFIQINHQRKSCRWQETSLEVMEEKDEFRAAYESSQGLVRNTNRMHIHSRRNRVSINDMQVQQEQIRVSSPFL